jgi:RNA-directed DNA polymerase
MPSSTGGRWKRGGPVGHPRVPGRCAEKCHHNGLVGTQPTDQLLPRQRSTLLNIRRYQGKLLIKPSKAALRRIRERLAAEMKALRGANVVAVIRRLNRIIRGWSAYYRTVVSSEAFAKLDSYLWTLTFKWARYSHPNKPKHWVVKRYFGAFNRSRQDRWVLGDRHSGAYLLKFSWTKIVRHQMVRGAASPDDPALAEYWARRRQRQPPPLDGLSVRLLRAQRGRCPVCGALLLHADREPQSLPEWEQWLTVTRKAVRKQAVIAERGPETPDEPVTFRLVHAHCRPRPVAVAGRRAQQHSCSPLRIGSA